MIFYISFLLFNIVMCVHDRHLSSKTTLSLASPCSVGLKFATEVNNTSGDDYLVELSPNLCCLDFDDKKCDIVVINGGDRDEIPQGTTRTLYLVAPLLDPYNRKGFCTAFLDYRSSDGARNIRRENIKVNFDTTLKTDSPETLQDNVKICKNVDEDSLNDCNPVNCDTYYNGHKAYYNNKLKRCVDPPVCSDETNTELSEVIYNPISNKCIKRHSITSKDIDFIKSINQNGRKAKNIVIIENSITDLNYINKTDGQYRMRLNKTHGTTNHMRFAFMKCLKANTYMSTILIVVILIQCILICTIVYCMSKSCVCAEKKVVRKFFNYKQDASVTTPLIHTSNANTETTEYYPSESSNNIDKKIKCYKACQKERNNNLKLSMSDDILSKCLNRRDWNRLPRSETIPEAHVEDNFTNIEAKKTIETKVNISNSNDDQATTVKSIIKKIECDSHELVNVVSEREIKYHNYNIRENSSAFKNKYFGALKMKASNIEKGAQAYFSNDSVDDFLSERGMMYMGENPSKYSITSVSSDERSTILSSRTSKTSKNNVIKRVISLFSRKSKGPSSEPGLKKSKAELDLELIHMSRASLYSSSNDEYAKSLKRLKDSRSSL